MADMTAFSWRKGIAVASAVCALVVAVGPAWLALGLPIIATHEHVAETVGKVQTQVRSIDIKAAEGRIETLEVRRTLVDKEIFEIELLLRRQPEMDPGVRSTLELRRRALDDDRKTLDHRFEQMQRFVTGRRP